MSHFFFLSYLVSASKEELEFDSTVYRALETPLRYRIENVFYGTIGDPLSQYDASSMFSPSTRVWRVPKKSAVNSKGWCYKVHVRLQIGG